MFNPLKSLAYKNEVLATLYSILYLHPGGTKRLVKDYPRILQTIKTNRKENTPATATGVYIASIVLTNTLQILSDKDREVVLSQLADLDMSAFKRMLNRTKEGDYSFPSGTLYATIAVGLAVMMVRHYAREGSISAHDVRMFQTEIEGALQGLDENSRFTGRMQRFFDDMFASPA